MWLAAAATPWPAAAWAAVATLPQDFLRHHELPRYHEPVPTRWPVATPAIQCPASAPPCRHRTAIIAVDGGGRRTSKRIRLATNPSPGGHAWGNRKPWGRRNSPHLHNRCHRRDLHCTRHGAAMSHGGHQVARSRRWPSSSALPGCLRGPGGGGGKRARRKRTSGRRRWRRPGCPGATASAGAPAGRTPHRLPNTMPNIQTA